MQLTRITLSNRRNAYGEYVIRAYDINGKRYPDADYHTADKDDAENTYRAMLTSVQGSGVGIDYSI